MLGCNQKVAPASRAMRVTQLRTPASPTDRSHASGHHLRRARSACYRKRMPESKTYSGGCHCGEVRYEVKTDLGKVISCNCSFCSKKGLLLTFVPPEAFNLRSGDDSLTDYQFNKKRIHHLFCNICGTSSFSRASLPDDATMFAVNVRCLDDVDPAHLTITPVDGKIF
jgi:hypothetical protein